MNPFALFAKKSESPAPANQPKQQEQAFNFDSNIVHLMGGFEYYNPDELTYRKGNGIYDKMLLDPQVKSVYSLFINIIVSRKFNFVKTNDDPIQDEIVKFFQYNVEQSIRGTFIKALQSVLRSKKYGYSITEKNYRPQLWENRQTWVIDTLKSKPFGSFIFDVDEFANIKALKQEQNSIQKKLDKNKFIINVNNPEIDPIYGESELKSVYRPYWEKDIIQRLQNIWLEKYSGFTVAKQNDNAPNLNPTAKAALQNVLSNLSTSTSVSLPAGYDIDVVQGNDTEAFDKAIVQKNKEIGKGLLVPSNLGFSEQGNTGSNAQAEIQLEAFLMLVKTESDMLADVMNEQLFSELALINFGVEEYPLMQFEEFTTSQKNDVVKAWGEAIKAGIAINGVEDEKRTRSFLDYPDLTDEEIKERDKVEDKAIDDATGDEVKPEPEPEKEPEPKVKASAPTVKENLTVEVTNKENLSVEPETDELNFAETIDFKELAAIFDKNEASFKADLETAVDEIYKDILIKVKDVKSGIREKGKINYEAIAKDFTDNTIKPASRRLLRQELEINLKDNYQLGREKAKEVVLEKTKTANAETKKRVQLSLSLNDPVCVTLDAGKWSILQFVEGITTQKANDWIKSQSFTITGDVSNDMLEAAQTVLLNSIRDELSIQATVDQLEQVLSGLVPSTDPETGKKRTRARLETIARTNISTIFNQAQMAVYADPAFADLIEAYRYSAVLDSRTTHFCEVYNQRVFLKNDPIWNTITPPNHFNCRSVIVPETIVDQFKINNAVKVNPSKGFGMAIEDINRKDYE